MKPKNPAAMVLGSLGGKASAKSLTKQQRHERARNAAKAQTPEQRSEAAKKGWQKRAENKP